MQWYSIEPRTRKYFKGSGFLSFARKYKKQLLDTGQNSLKTVSKKTGEILGNKIADAVTKSNTDKFVKPGENPRNVKKLIILLEKRDGILNELRKVL